MFVQNEVSLRRFGYVDYCFAVREGRQRDVRVTIAWSDPPGDTMADMSLINNLVRSSCVMAT
jgi:hypothetical protein